MIKDPEELKQFVLQALDEKKADNVQLMELGDDVSLAKYMIFASGRSKKNVSAIADYVASELKHKAKRKLKLEGMNNSDWVLLDVGEIIVHIFHPEAREHFKLEEFWQGK